MEFKEVEDRTQKFNEMEQTQRNKEMEQCKKTRIFFKERQDQLNTNVIQLTPMPFFQFFFYNLHFFLKYTFFLEYKGKAK